MSDLRYNVWAIICVVGIFVGSAAAVLNTIWGWDEYRSQYWLMMIVWIITLNEWKDEKNRAERFKSLLW